MRTLASFLGVVLLAATAAPALGAPARCQDELDAIRLINPGNGPNQPPAFGKNCAAQPVSPPGQGFGNNPGNNKPVGNAGEKGEVAGNQDKGNSQKSGDWNPKAPKAN